MPSEVPIEQRLSAVEAAVDEIRRRLPPEPRTSWLERITGSFRDEPAFDEVLAYGRMLREADRLSEGESEGG